MDKKYYTVAEFAKKAGISRQSAYRKIDKYLSQYCKLENGQKYISEAAFKDKTFAREIQNVQLSDDSIETVLNLLQEQLARKDEQIEKLQEQLTELTKAFREAQALHAGTMQRELSDNSTANNKHRWWKFWQKGK